MGNKAPAQSPSPAVSSTKLSRKPVLLALNPAQGGCVPRSSDTTEPQPHGDTDLHLEQRGVRVPGEASRPQIRPHTRQPLWRGSSLQVALALGHLASCCWFLLVPFPLLIL